MERDEREREHEEREDRDRRGREEDEDGENENEQAMWSVFLANLPSSFNSEELTRLYRNKAGGDHLYAGEVSVDDEGVSKGYGFLHYTDHAAYTRSLDQNAQVEVDGRTVKAYPAEDKKKVYVRNLPRGMSDEQLKQELEKLAGRFETVNLRGEYCFLTYINYRVTERALRRLNGATLGGQTLFAEPAKAQRLRDSARSDDSRPNTSLHIRNISSSTSVDSLQNYFSSIGPIRECRIPKNRDTGANQGFAFVEYESSDDASRALARLNHTRLDGAQIEIAYSKNKNARRENDDRRGGRGDDRRRDDRRGGGYGAAPGAPLMPYPYGYPMGASGSRGGMPAIPPYYMYPGAAAAGAAGAGGSGRGGRDAAGSGSGAAFPYGALPPQMAAAYGMYAADPRWAAAYGMMAQQAAGGAAAAAGYKREGRRRSRSRSRSRSPRRRDRSSSRSNSRSRSRSRSRDRRRR